LKIRTGTSRLLSHFLTETDWLRTDLVGGHWFIDLVELELPERDNQPSSSPRH